MEIDYRLGESVIGVEGTIDRIRDAKVDADERDWGTVDADVVLTRPR
ncbi:MAG: hypothetical protein ACRD29_09255 [Acidimicrobiales bacterium]